MAFSFTGIVYFFGLLVMVVFTYRMAKLYQKQKTNFAKFFFYGLLSLLINLLIITVISLFFSNSALLLKTAVIVSILLQSLGFIVIAKAFFPLIFPESSFRLFEIILFLFTLLAMILYFQSMRTPFLDFSGFINWNVPVSVGIIRLLIFIVSACFSLSLLFREVKSEIEKVRKKSIILIVLAVGGIICFLSFFVIFRTSGMSEAFVIIFFVFIIGILTFLGREETNRFQR